MIKDIREFNRKVEPQQEVAEFNKEIQPVEETPVVEPQVVKKTPKEVLKKEVIEETTEEELRKEKELQQEIVDNTEKDEKAILENRIKELEEERKGKEAENKTKKIRKKFRVPLAFKSMGRKAAKNPEYVFIQYLSLKKEVSYKVCRIIAGDVIVVGNKVHEINPEAVWKYKKTLFYIIKEIDRQPVSNIDYDSIVLRKDDTQADVPLLKAVFGATNKSSGMMKDKNIVIWVILGALAIGGLILFSGGGA